MTTKPTTEELLQSLADTAVSGAVAEGDDSMRELADLLASFVQQRLHAIEEID